MLGACTQENHFDEDMPQDENTDKYDKSAGVGFLGNDLEWEDLADIQSGINHLRFLVTGNNGVNEVREFNNPLEASEWMLELPTGEYDVLVTANMATKNGFELTETTPTKAALLMEPTYVKLLDIAKEPEQAWNGLAHVKVENNQMSTVHLNLDRLMALFTFKLKNVPDGTTIDVRLRNAANHVNLCEERSSGHWGVPSRTISDDIPVGQLNAANNLTGINEFRVFPTATGIDHTMLLLHIKTNKGIELDYEGVAPTMTNGKKYELELDYEKLTPFMYITSTSINDWTDEWSYSGEVLNPEEEQNESK